MAEAIEAGGALFVDGALMGGLSMQHHKVPTLLSGRGSEPFIERLSPFGMCLSKVRHGLTAREPPAYSPGAKGMAVFD